ncbi:30S ribosomal protein S21 [bacterium]|nr:30S ribosomal protein S21 [bacterium]
MVSIKKKNNETIESMLKRFRKKVEQSGLMYELQYRQYFVKPSLAKKIRKLKPWRTR